ncbi:hypothetical protein [Nannocystis bainbridge]|uniref:Uncharacterized protein n=1 Tax=Nannocystis bainbridge TaxID=2995303 RepID=A0ABT5E8H6_9BACT|nr:hypothetical protein [Nannocystis bainbridge]MDC0721203.1 hypothetical protein [Nannocystis bainbridge]
MVDRRSPKDPRGWLAEARERRFRLAAERRAAARGALINRLRRQERLLGFVSDLEGPPGGPWFLKVECLDKRWMEEVYAELQTTDFDLSDLEETANLPTLSGEGILAGFLAGRPFATAFEHGTVEQRYALGAVRRWFVDRSIDGTSSLPVHSLFEARVDARTLEAVPEVGQWLELTIWPPEDANDWDDAYGTLVRLFDHEPFIAPPEPMQIRQLRVLPEPWQGVIQALHFPAPEGDEIEFEEEPVDEEPPTFGGGGGGGGWGLFRQAYHDLRERARRWLESLAEHPWLHPVPAFAGAGGFILGGGSDDDEVPRMRLRAYVGSPKAAPMAAAGQANPMVGGGQQAFIGLVDVGQGNCNMIVDSNWRVLAYYDFGHSVRGDGPDELPRLCFCHDPYVILSHWDQDHYMLHAKIPECYRATWIVPRQGTGNIGTCVTGKVKRAGGQVYTWAAGHPSHMAFPWGFVERCQGAPAGPDRNSSGLAVYVCCKDRNANPDTPGGQPWSVAGPPGALVAAAASAFAVRARAAVANAGAGTVARCLASVLANSRFGNGLTAVNCTLVATQAEADAVAQVAGGAPVPDPAAVVLAVTPGLAASSTTSVTRSLRPGPLAVRASPPPCARRCSAATSPTPRRPPPRASPSRPSRWRWLARRCCRTWRRWRRRRAPTTR